MADYIDDTGSHSLDAELSGTYTTQAANHALTLGADGEADSGFTLPTTSDWLLVETFNVEDVATDIGYTKWQSDVSQITTDMAAIRTIVVSDSAITLFEMVATHYKSSTGKVDVYRADETTAFPSTPETLDTDLDFTFPTANWVVTDTVTAPDSASAAGLSSLYMSIGGTPAVPVDDPTGITITKYTGGGIPAYPVPFLYDDGTPSGIQYTYDIFVSTLTSNQPMDGSDEGFLFDRQYQTAAYRSGTVTNTFTISGLNPDHTYSFLTGATNATSGRDFTININGAGAVSFDPERNIAEDVTGGNLYEGVTETGITGVNEFDVVFTPGTAGYWFCGGFTLHRTAGTDIANDIAYLSVGRPQQENYPPPHSEWIIYSTADTAVNTINAINGEDTGWTYQITEAFGGSSTPYQGTYNEGGAMPDCIMTKCLYCGTGQVTFTVDPSPATYTIRATGSSYLTGDTRTLTTTVNAGDTQNLECTENYTGENVHTGVIPNGSDQIVLQFSSTGSANAYVSGYSIERTS